MLHGIVKDTITLLNFFPNSETIDGTPRTFLDGERLDYARWSRVYAGQVAEFEVPYPKQLNRGTRREIGYVIGHQGDNPIVRLLPAGKKMVIRSSHVRVLDKTPAIISLIEQGISGAKRQRYNDLLAEMQEFFDSPDEDGDRPLPNARLVEWQRPTDETTEGREEGPNEPTIVVEDTPMPPVQPAEQDADPRIPDPIIAHPQETSAPIMAPPEITSDPPEPAEGTRRSTRAGAQKPPGFYSKLSSGESVSDYTACHMRAQECSNLYGPEMTDNAGITEVINMIKVRKAAIPTDYRKLSPRVLKEALPSFMFYKAKDLLPGEEDHPTQDSQPAEDSDSDSTISWTEVRSKRKRKQRKAKKKVKIRGRWVGGGHRQQRGEILAERVAPTARGTTHSILMAIAAFEGRQLRVGDIPSAYLQADHVPANGRPVFIVADRHTTELIIKAMPEYQGLVRPNGTMVLQVAKAMYGLVESAWLWYKELEKHLLHLGYCVSHNDGGLFYKHVIKDGKRIASNIASVHVDDIISAATPNKEGAKLEQEFWGSMESRWPGIKLQRGPEYKHLSWNIRQCPKTGEIRKSQRDYLLEVVKTSGVEKEHNLPCRLDLTESDPNSPNLTEIMVSRFRSTLQKIAYAREGRPDFDFAVCFLQSKQSKPTLQDWKDLEHLLGYIKRFPEKEVIFKPKDLQLRGLKDNFGR